VISGWNCHSKGYAGGERLQAARTSGIRHSQPLAWRGGRPDVLSGPDLDHGLPPVPASRVRLAPLLYGDR
jgi:hypothetical protein